MYYHSFLPTRRRFRLEIRKECTFLKVSQSKFWCPGCAPAAEKFWHRHCTLIEKILCNVICKQNPNYHTKKDWKSKSKSCFKQKWIWNQNTVTSDFRNPKSFIPFSQYSKNIHFQHQQHLKLFVCVYFYVHFNQPTELSRDSTGAEEGSLVVQVTNSFFSGLQVQQSEQT